MGATVALTVTAVFAVASLGTCDSCCIYVWRLWNCLALAESAVISCLNERLGKEQASLLRASRLLVNTRF